MTNFRALLLLLLFLGIGCSSSKEIAESKPSPKEGENVLTIEDLGPSNDWHLLDFQGTPYYGTGVKRAYEELLADKTPVKEVVVAIIDSGTDIEHEDLSGNVWVNSDEVSGNGEDDDNNGYIDDVHGWNFIGGPDGTHVRNDTYEVTRLYARLGAKFEEMNPDSVPESMQNEYDYYLEIKDDYQEERNNVQQNLSQLKNIYQAIQGSKQLLGIAHIDSATAETLAPKSTDGPYLKQAKQLVTLMQENGISEEDIKEGVDQFQSLWDYGVNPDFDPRDIVGDDYYDLTDRIYGNSDVSGVRNSHGTHVAGIVAAVRDNDLGINGIAPARLMILRTVPNGDERDKDVANAIRYAAENGADVINMSFGKGYSPQKTYVDAAVRFADSLGVLMIHGAGNDASNIDSTDNYPSKHYVTGSSAENFITVGASSWLTGNDLTAGFSNYGTLNVDIFAPGVAIYSTYPDNEYKAEDGTSMASPVVAGVAALVMAYYPELTASEVKDILLRSATDLSDMLVNRPGSETEVPFSTLSVTGGIVNAYEALKLAEQMVSGN
jgi:subtilisin family serine protease